MDFAPGPMVLGEPLEVHKPWWDSVVTGDHQTVRQMLRSRDPFIAAGGARLAVLSMATASARRVSAEAATPLVVACDGGHVEVVGALLEAGADPCQHIALSIPADGNYEPDEDDFGSWLAPLSPLDRAMERGHGAVVELLLRSRPSDLWDELSARLEKLSHKTRGAAGGWLERPAVTYAASFAGSRGAAVAALSRLHPPPSPEELARPLAIALSRGAAGVSQALLDMGADPETPARTPESWRATAVCRRPLCIAAHALNNPACPAVLLRAGAAVHHPSGSECRRRADYDDTTEVGLATDGDGVAAHFAWEECEIALYRFERHLQTGLLSSVPERAVRLARDTAEVFAIRKEGTPLEWEPAAHHRFPATFRQQTRELLMCIYNVSTVERRPGRPQFGQLDATHGILKKGQADNTFGGREAVGADGICAEAWGMPVAIRCSGEKPRKAGANGDGVEEEEKAVCTASWALSTTVVGGHGSPQQTHANGKGKQAGQALEDEDATALRSALQIFQALPEPFLRQQVVLRLVACLAHMQVWGCLPAEFWEAELSPHNSGTHSVPAE